MQRALELAQRGQFTTKPNPMVGCVIAHGDRVVGEGWHQRAGDVHAEAHALQQAAGAARGGTAYVTLEPCGLYGRTPPCADALIAAGIVRVVVATEDISQRAGQGMQKLAAAGVTVESGLMREQARFINRGFLSRTERGRPWLRVKLAMSLDGRTALASGESKWITSDAAREDVQRWRARSGALLTGYRTVMADDPQLNVRLPDGENYITPLRVVLDTRGELPANRRILDNQASTLLVHADDTVPGYQEDAEGFAVRRVQGKLDLPAVLSQLGQRGINEVQVEAGPTLAGSLLRAKLIDELLIYMAPVVLGEQGRPLFAGVMIGNIIDRIGFRFVDTQMIGSDIRLQLLPIN